MALNDHQWAISLVSALIDLYSAIWADRNTHIHGSNRIEAQKLLKEHLIAQVQSIYCHPLNLDKRFQRIQKMPFSDCIRRSNTYLQRWIKRIEHQEKTID